MSPSSARIFISQAEQRCQSKARSRSSVVRIVKANFTTFGINESASYHHQNQNLECRTMFQFQAGDVRKKKYEEAENLVRRDSPHMAHKKASTRSFDALWKDGILRFHASATFRRGTSLRKFDDLEKKVVFFCRFDIFIFVSICSSF